MSGAARRGPFALAALMSLAPLGCDQLRLERAPGPEETVVRSTPPPVRTPDALLVRFREDQGEGFSREGWEIEILQMGSDVRVRGAVRTAGASVPIYRQLGPIAYEEFWSWLEPFPLDRYRIEENKDATPPGWRKSLEVDIVLADRRLVSRNEWTRPLVDAAWMQELEDHLHLMALDYAHQELRAEPTGGPPPGIEDTREGIRRALDALGDAEVTNLPGGAPDAE